MTFLFFSKITFSKKISLADWEFSPSRLSYQYMSADRLQYLLEQLFHHACTEEEKEELALWIDTLQNDEEWKNHLSRIWNSYEPDEKMDPYHADAILKQILQKEKENNPYAKQLTPRFSSVSSQMMRWSVAAAAVVGILILLSIIFLTKKPLPVNNTSEGTIAANDIKPGGNKATLTLANGKVIVLDSVHNGVLANQRAGNVVKVSAGLLKYDQSSIINPQSSAEYNMITTPLGGQYQIILSDGSKVWLNAGSSLKFPVAFSEKERKVFVSGEAYFEIAQNAQTPFIVHILSGKGQPEGVIQVLGTDFNINAYNDAPSVKTTLVDGSVKVLNGDNKQLLLPGEQAEMQDNGSIKVNKNINLDEIIAWKNGLFDFEGNDIEEVMNQIAKWYNVEVNYAAIPPAHFVGTISRNVNIPEVLKMLEMTGAAHFKVEGRTVTVMN